RQPRRYFTSRPDLAVDRAGAGRLACRCRAADDPRRPGTLWRTHLRADRCSASAGTEAADTLRPDEETTHHPQTGYLSFPTTPLRHPSSLRRAVPVALGLECVPKSLSE